MDASIKLALELRNLSLTENNVSPLSITTDTKDTNMSYTNKNINGRNKNSSLFKGDFFVSNSFSSNSFDSYNNINLKLIIEKTKAHYRIIYSKNNKMILQLRKDIICIYLH